jgi:hypothetical protein
MFDYTSSRYLDLQQPSNEIPAQIRLSEKNTT